MRPWFQTPSKLLKRPHAGRFAEISKESKGGEEKTIEEKAK